jgi:hypothetical protein
MIEKAMSSQHPAFSLKQLTISNSKLQTGSLAVAND